MKIFTVIMNNEELFGPERDYEKVKSFTDGLAPAVKSKCSIKVENIPDDAPKVAKKDTNAVKQKVAAPEANANSIFDTFLEGGGQSDFWKPKDGRNIIRILPIGGVLPTDWVTPYPFILSGVHPNVGLSLREMVYCARLTHNKACPICNFVWKLYNTKDENEIKIAKTIKAYNRVIANIIDLSDIDKGVQKFAFGKTLARKIMSYIEDPEFVPLLDPEKGHNFIVIKKIVDTYPNYDDSRPEVKTTALSQLYPKWREECNDLKKDVVEKSYDELMAILVDTKKAMLSTSPDEIGNTGARPKPVESHAEQPSVEEVSLDELKSRLENI